MKFVIGIMGVKVLNVGLYCVINGVKFSDFVDMIILMFIGYNFVVFYKVLMIK